MIKRVMRSEDNAHKNRLGRAAGFLLAALMLVGAFGLAGGLRVWAAPRDSGKAKPGGGAKGTSRSQCGKWCNFCLKNGDGQGFGWKYYEFDKGNPPGTEVIRMPNGAHEVTIGSLLI